MLGFVDKRDSQINLYLIQNRISSPDATLNHAAMKKGPPGPSEKKAVVLIWIGTAIFLIGVIWLSH